MSGGPRRIVPHRAPQRAVAPKPAAPVGKKPPAPAPAYAAAGRSGVTGLILRVVGQLFAPLEKPWNDVKAAAKAIVKSVEEEIIDPFVDGAIAVYEAVMDADGSAMAEAKGTGKPPAAKASSALVVPPADAALGGGLAVVDAVSVPLGVMDVAGAKTPLVPLAFLSTWGAQGEVPVTASLGAKAGKAGTAPSTGNSMADVPAGTAGFADATSWHWAVHGTPTARHAGEPVSSGVVCVTGGCQLVTAGAEWSGFFGASVPSAPWGGEERVASDGMWPATPLRPGESFDIIAAAFREAMGVPASPSVAPATRTPAETSVSRGGIPAWGGGAHPHASGHGFATTVPTVSDTVSIAGDGVTTHFPAPPLSILSVGAGLAHTTGGPRHADRIAATIAGEHAHGDGSGGRGGSGSQSSSHDDGEHGDELYAERTDPEIRLG